MTKKVFTDTSTGYTIFLYGHESSDYLGYFKYKKNLFSSFVLNKEQSKKLIDNFSKNIFSYPLNHELTGRVENHQIIFDNPNNLLLGMDSCYYASPELSLRNNLCLLGLGLKDSGLINTNLESFMSFSKETITESNFVKPIVQYCGQAKVKSLISKKEYYIEEMPKSPDDSSDGYWKIWNIYNNFSLLADVCCLPDKRLVLFCFSPLTIKYTNRFSSYEELWDNYILKQISIQLHLTKYKAEITAEGDLDKFTGMKDPEFESLIIGSSLI